MKFTVLFFAMLIAYVIEDVTGLKVADKAERAFDKFNEERLGYEH